MVVVKYQPPQQRLPPCRFEEGVMPILRNINPYDQMLLRLPYLSLS
jgi:hypothetical protein